MNTKVKKYLKYLKFKKFYKPKLKACELCGSKAKLLRKKISWNNNKFGILPVHCCKIVDLFFKIQDLVKSFILIITRKPIGI